MHQSVDGVSKRDIFVRMIDRTWRSLIFLLLATGGQIFPMFSFDCSKREAGCYYTH